MVIHPRYIFVQNKAIETDEPCRRFSERLHVQSIDEIKNKMTMKERMTIDKIEPRIYEAMDAAEKQLASFDLDPKLQELVKLRASQINGCGYCVVMHSRDARKLGENERRVFAVAAWWETPFFTDAEQAALKLAEEVTLISEGGLTESTYQQAAKHFSQAQIAQLIFTVVVTNSWNRIAISTHMIADQA